MRRGRLTSIGTITIDHDCPTPAITAADQILVKVKYSAVNADDYNVFSGTFPSPYDDQTLLHEMSGEIVELGEEAKHLGFSVGDRCSSNVSFGCGVCPMCRQGRPNLCLDKHGLGASSDYRIFSANSLVRLPDNISLEEGSLYWLVTCCIQGLERANLRPNQSVLILGGGSTGLMLLQIIKRHMPKIVVVSEPIAYKRELAMTLGASSVINPTVDNIEELTLELTRGLGFDLVIDAAGAISALENVTSFVARGGTLMLFSYYHINDCLRLNLMETYWKELTVCSSYGANLSPFTATDANALQYLDLKSIIGDVIPFERMQEAFERYGTHENLRLLIEY